MNRLEIMEQAHKELKERYKCAESTFKAVQSVDSRIDRVWNQSFLNNCETEYFAKK